MPNQPLNPDALEAAARAYQVARTKPFTGGSFDRAVDLLRESIPAYLTVAQPVVSTVEALDALPLDSVVLSGTGTVRYKWSESRWYSTNDHHGYYLNVDIELPARVLYRPEVKP